MLTEVLLLSSVIGTLLLHKNEKEKEGDTLRVIPPTSAALIQSRDTLKFLRELEEQEVKKYEQLQKEFKVPNQLIGLDFLTHQKKTAGFLLK